MTPITVSIHVDRPQEEVFAYVTDPSRFAEWQAGVVGGHMENGAAVSVGSKSAATRSSPTRSPTRSTCGNTDPG